MSFTTATRRINHALILASCLGATLAMAQTEPSLNEVYAAARAGKLEQAQTMVLQVLVAHPNSAKAFYVRSELFARQGEQRHAQASFTAAQKLAPGLPFAKPEAVQALRAQLSSTSSNSALPAIATQPGVKQSNAPLPASWGLPLLLAAGLVAGVYMLFRRRPPQPMAMQPAGPFGGGSGSTDGQGISGGAGAMQPNHGQRTYPQPGHGQAGYAPPVSSGLGGRIPSWVELPLSWPWAPGWLQQKRSDATSWGDRTAVPPPATISATGANPRSTPTVTWAGRTSV
jgi:hypothetical protein